MGSDGRSLKSPISDVDLCVFCCFCFSVVVVLVFCCGHSSVRRWWGGMWGVDWVGGLTVSGLAAIVGGFMGCGWVVFFVVVFLVFLWWWFWCSTMGVLV